jgi:hypothetical protein
MGKKRLIKIGAMIGFGLFFLVLGLYAYWIIHFNYFFSYRFDWTYVSYEALIGVAILSGFALTVLGGLAAFRVKLPWWRIASFLLFVSLILPWWQWSFRVPNAIPEVRSAMWETHNFLFGFSETNVHLGFRNILARSFSTYLVLKGSTYSWPFDQLIVEPWLNAFLVQILCYVVFGLILSTTVLGWSGKKKQRSIGVITGCASLVIFMIWVFLAWSAFGLSSVYRDIMNPYFVLRPYGYSFLSSGFFVALIGIIVLVISFFVKDVART